MNSNLPWEWQLDSDSNRLGRLQRWPSDEARSSHNLMRVVEAARHVSNEIARRHRSRDAPFTTRGYQLARVAQLTQLVRGGHRYPNSPPRLRIHSTGRAAADRCSIRPSRWLGSPQRRTQGAHAQRGAQGELKWTCRRGALRFGAADSVRLRSSRWRLIRAGSRSWAVEFQVALEQGEARSQLRERVLRLGANLVNPRTRVLLVKIGGEIHIRLCR